MRTTMILPRDATADFSMKLARSVMTSKRNMLILLLALMFGTSVTGETFTDSCKDTPLGEAPESSAAFAAACTATAITEPYKLAWLLFAKICHLDSSAPRSCEWQSWATNNQTFPIQPIESDPPKWPVDAAAEEFPCMEGSLIKGFLERRRNRAEFTYIVDHDLWFQEGLGRVYASNDEIDLPANALDVAVSWKEIDEEEKSRYYWKVLEDGTLCGLTNLDAKSKILPNWFFFSFEHVDNPGRCDFTGCRDDFGQTPRFIPPIVKTPTPKYHDPEKPSDRPTYEPGALTPELTKLLGVTGVWQNYRLKGIQTDFVTPEGKPTVLAGSQIEGVVFPASSSCITCHSRSGFNYQGQNLYGGGEVGVFQVSPIGPPDPSWFYDMGPDGWQLRYQQSDYVWAIPINVCPLKCPTNDADRKLLPTRCRCGA